mgnify:CR=1 FL=1
MRDATVMGVQAPNGQVAFTRRGDLMIDAGGFITTANGHTVLQEGGGPIAVPPGAEADSQVYLWPRFAGAEGGGGPRVHERQDRSGAGR